MTRSTGRPPGRPPGPARFCTLRSCRQTYEANGYCRAHNRRFKLYGDPLGVPARPGGDPMARFMSKIVVDDTTGCWLWQGSLSDDGYSRFRMPNRWWIGHRWAWAFIGGHELPTKPYEIDHRCDVRRCVNPRHLRVLTHKDNVRRSRVGTPNRRKQRCPAGHPYSGNNLVVGRQGARSCRSCKNSGKRAARLVSKVPSTRINRRRRR